MNNTSKNVLAILGFLTLVLIAIFAPLISVWSVNTLFNLNIAYSFVNWLATVWLTMLVTYKVIKK